VNYELLIRGKAKTDIRRAAKWYEYQQKGLGREFVAEVDAALIRIQGNPQRTKSFIAKFGMPFFGGFLTVFSSGFKDQESACLLFFILNGTISRRGCHKSSTR